MSHKIELAFSIGVLLLGAALFIPAVIDTTQGNAADTFKLDNQTSDDLTDTLTVEALDVNETGSNATIEIENSRTLETNKTLINTTETESIELSGDTINVTLDAIDDEQTTLTVAYPATFGWAEEPRTFIDNLGLMMAVLAVVIVLAGIMMTLKP